MTPEMADTVITEFLMEISGRLDEAARIARDAEACAETGDPQKAVTIVMGIEHPMFDANTLLNAVSLLKLRFRPADEHRD